MTFLVFSPNWLGDAVMALAAVADVRRHAGLERLVVAARPRVAELWRIVPGVDAVVTIPPARGAARWATLRANVKTVQEVNADVAVLLPNSFQTALAARRAGIPERWGYRGNLRGWLLSHPVRRPRGVMHQVDYYRHLVAELGIKNGPRTPRLEVPQGVLDTAQAVLGGHGWTPGVRLLGLAPGAAYGGAKRWLPSRFAGVADRLGQSHGLKPVLVGTEADASAAYAIEAELDKIGNAESRPGPINLVGRTDLRQLIGVIAICAAFVSNDSGAMHLAAALGVPVAAVFGPTDERITAPVGDRVRVLTSDAWCRPCLLRECPLDHRCMRDVGADMVARAVGEML
jgi:heptosyltransferase-2